MTILTFENPKYLGEIEIPYLGPARKRYLDEWFLVDTVQGLAGLSADDVEAKFKAKGKTVARDKIEKWIAKAQELAGQSSPRVTKSTDTKTGGKVKSPAEKGGSSQPSLESADAKAGKKVKSPAEKGGSSRRSLESADAKAGKKANSPATETEWKSFASFVVVFQVRQPKDQTEEQRIKVHHKESDKHEKWSGIEGEQPWRWMLDQLGEKVQQVPQSERLTGVQPAAASPVTVEIAQVQAFQRPQAETPIAIGKAGRQFQGFVRSGEPFALEVSFELAGPGAADIVKRQATYSAQFHVRNLTTRAKTPLGDTKAISLVGETPYTAILPQASLQPGLYRLQALVTLQSTPPIVGYLKVPMLQVV